MVATIIILIILAFVIYVALHASKERFQSGCCGGCGDGGCGSNLSIKKLKNSTGKVISKKKMVIEGMTCSHCSATVENAIGSIAGASAKVDLDKKEAVIKLRKVVADEALRKAVQDAGYSVVEISDLA